MRIEIKGLYWTQVKLADGSQKKYWYAWKNGPPLRGQPGEPEFIASYNEAVATRKPESKKTLGWLIKDYQTGGHFRQTIRPRTRDDYTKILTKIDKKFGDMPLKATERKETRGIFMRWRDQLAKASVRQADYTMAVLSAVFSHGIEYGAISVNPIARSGRLYSGTRVDIIWTSEQIAAFLKVAPPHLHLPLLVALWTRVDIIWTSEQIAAFLKVAPPHLHLPLLVALWTGLHQGDVLNLTWSAYVEEGGRKFIRVRQRKSVRADGTRAKYLNVPVGEPLRGASEGRARRSGQTKEVAAHYAEFRRQAVGAARSWVPLVLAQGQHQGEPARRRAVHGSTRDGGHATSPRRLQGFADMCLHRASDGRGQRHSGSALPPPRSSASARCDQEIGNGVCVPCADSVTG
jgi:integrase